MQQSVVYPFHRGLDRDTDIRLLAKGSYLDAMNVKITNALSGRAGVVTNMFGIKNIVDSVNTGLTGDTVLNVFPDRINNCLYVFIANSTTSVDRIVKYTPATATWSLVVGTSVLGFSATHRIKSFDVVEKFIFWTDDYNSPRMYDTTFDYAVAMGYAAYSASNPYVVGNEVSYNGNVYTCAVNVTGTAPSGTFASSYYWTYKASQGMDVSMFSAAVLVPNRAPTFVVSTDANFASNFIVGKFLQFKYRFVYANDQKSVFSPISAVVYSASDHDNPQTVSSGVPSNNVVTITIPNNNANRLVSKIEIAARSGNTGDFSLIKTIDTDSTFFTSGTSFAFYNNGISTTISLVESNQIYDEFPITARTQRYSNNRMFYAGTTNGYDKPTLSASLSVITKDRPDTSEAEFISSDMSCLSNSATLASVMSTYTSPQPGDIIVCKGLQDTSDYTHIPFGETTIEVGVGWDFDDIMAAINAVEMTVIDIYTYYPDTVGTGMNFTEQWAVIRNDVSPDDPLYGQTWYFWNGRMQFDLTKGGYAHEEIFKSGSRYQVGAQYFDEYGRTNGVILPLVSEIYIPTLAERGLTNGSLADAGGAYIVMQITSQAPSWAKYYNIVWANTYKDSFVLTTTIIEAKAGSTSSLIKANINSIKLSRDSYKTTLTYTWEKGDRVRFITMDRLSGGAAVSEWADKVYDAEIIASYTDYSGTDGFQSIEFYRPNGLTYTQCQYAQIEIYRPSVSYEAGEVLFHESPQMYDIVSGAHGGTISQTTSGTASGLAYYGVYSVSGINYIKLQISNMTSAIIVGDDITFAGSYTGTYNVHSVTYNGDGTVDVVIDSAPWSSTSLSAAGTISYTKVDKPAIVYLSNGDAFFRKRTLRLASDTEVFVEDYNLSDYIDSANYSLGRPTAIIEQSAQDNIATIFYTEAFIPNTSINGLNKIYPDQNYEEFGKNFGAIIHLHDEGNALIIFQEDKISQTMVEQSVMYDAQGNINYVGSLNAVLSKAIPYAGEYGLQTPFSFVNFGNRKYFVDLSRGVACRLSIDGITEISKQGLRGWFYDTSKTTQAQSDAEVFGLYDPIHDEYVMSFKYAQKTVCYNEEINEGAGGFSSFMSNHFTGGCALDNNIFYITASGIFEMNQPVATVSRNAVKAYGGTETPFESYIQFICNEQPALDKSFLALAIDGNAAWDVTITTEEGQESHLVYNLDFTARETEYQAAFLRDENTPNLAAGTAIFEGDKMKGKEAMIKLTMTSARYGTEKYIKFARVVISNA